MNSKSFMLLSIAGALWCIAAAGGAAAPLCALILLLLAFYHKRKTGDAGLLGFAVLVCCVVHAVTAGGAYGVVLAISAISAVIAVSGMQPFFRTPPDEMDDCKG